MNMYKYLKGECKEGGSRIFPAVLCDNKMGTTETQEVPPEYQEMLFEGVLKWVESESLWNLHSWKYSKARATGSWAASSRLSCLSRGLDQITSRGPCHPQSFCGPAQLCSQFQILSKNQTRNSVMTENALGRKQLRLKIIHGTNPGTVHINNSIDCSTCSGKNFKSAAFDPNQTMTQPGTSSTKPAEDCNIYL